MYITTIPCKEKGTVYVEIKSPIGVFSGVLKGNLSGINKQEICEIVLPPNAYEYL